MDGFVSKESLLEQSAYWSQWVEGCKRAGVPLVRIEGMMRMFLNQEQDLMVEGLSSFDSVMPEVLKTAWGH